MFSRLPESNATRQRRTGGLVVSTAVHVLVIALAVRATMLTATPAPKVVALPLPLFVVPRESAPTPPTTAPRTTATGATSTESVPPIPSPIISDVVSSTLPDIDVKLGMPSRNDFGPATGVSVGDPNGTAPNVADGSPLSERFVDKVIVALPGTEPRYPSMLQSAGVEGDVRAQFVVDTLGRVEPGSFRVLDATHDQFAAAVRTALMRARFKPAEAGGHKVRQLAEQVFTFRLGTRE